MYCRIYILSEKTWLNQNWAVLFNCKLLCILLNDFPINQVKSDSATIQHPDDKIQVRDTSARRGEVGEGRRRMERTRFVRKSLGTGDLWWNFCQLSDYWTIKPCPWGENADSAADEVISGHEEIWDTWVLARSFTSSVPLVTCGGFEKRVSKLLSTLTCHNSCMGAEAIVCFTD